MSPSNYHYLNAWDELARARSRQNGRPVGHNRRLYPTEPKPRYGEDILLRFHATDVVIFHANGSFTLQAKGWRTVTTLSTIRENSPVRLRSERGLWTVQVEPSADDPEPTVNYSTVDKPFRALEPGATVPEHACMKDDARAWRFCSTCFQYERARREFERMSKRLEHFGTFEKWSEEYKADRKRLRAERKAHREWYARNSVEFFDGITVDDLGFYPRKSAEKLWKAEAQRKRAYERSAKRAERERKKAERERIRAMRAWVRSSAPNVPKETPQEVLAWLYSNSVQITTDGLALLCKVVGVDGFSSWRALYRIGSETVADDWRAEPGCGGGLHFCATRRNSEVYADRLERKRALLCAVDPRELIVIGDKVKAPRCAVLAPWMAG